MTYVVHFREKRDGEIKVEAATEYDALQKVKGMIARGEIPANAWQDPIIGTQYVEQV